MVSAVLTTNPTSIPNGSLCQGQAHDLRGFDLSLDDDGSEAYHAFLHLHRLSEFDFRIHGGCLHRYPNHTNVVSSDIFRMFIGAHHTRNKGWSYRFWKSTGMQREHTVRCLWPQRPGGHLWTRRFHHHRLIVYGVV